MINPEFAEAHYNLGNTLLAKGFIEGAVVAYEGYIKYAPLQYAENVAQVKSITKELKTGSGDKS